MADKSNPFMSLLKETADSGDPPERLTPPHRIREWEDVGDEFEYDKHGPGSLDEPFRLSLDETWNFSANKYKNLFSGAQKWCRTIHVAVVTSGTSTGWVLFCLKGTRWGAPFTQYFQLGAGQHVAINADGMRNGSIDVCGNSIVVTSETAQVYAAMSPNSRSDTDLSTAFWYAEYTPAAILPLTVEKVPDGAIAARLASNVTSWNWLVSDTLAAMTAITTPGPTAIGNSADVEGSRFTIGIGPAAKVVWTIRL